MSSPEEFLRKLEAQKLRFVIALSSVVFPVTVIQSIIRWNAGLKLPALINCVLMVGALISLVLALKRKLNPAAHALALLASITTGLNQFVTSSGTIAPLLNVLVLFAASVYMLPLKWGIFYGVLAFVRAITIRLLSDVWGIRGDSPIVPVTEWYTAMFVSFFVFFYVMVARETSAHRLLDTYRQAAQTRARFLSRMSHEIRTPLNGVLGIGEVLGEKLHEPEQKEYLRIMMNSGRHLLHIVNQVLELARTENRITLVRENYEPALLLNQVAELFRSALTSKDLGVQIEVDPALPRVVSGDEGSVRQILVNLMHNAVKFTEKGGISLRVRTDASGGLERIIYSVEDSGRGISAEKVTSVFDAFEQGDVTTATADGTGLGLAICRELCAQMDGVIELRSKKSEGSAFIVSLPLFMPVTGVVPVESKTGIKSFPEGSVAVLYVEDDGVNRTLMEAFLKPPQFLLTVAPDGATAIESFSKKKFDIVLMDLHLPDMSGYEILSEMRKIENQIGQKHTPVIAVSASVIAEEVTRSLEAGFAHHLGKPISKSGLMAAMHRVLDPELS